MCFFFGGFFFAFVYLRLQNVNDHWNPVDAKPSMPLAIAVLAATVLAAVLLLSLRGRHRAHEPASWRARGLVVLPLILVAIAVMYSCSSGRSVSTLPRAGSSPC